jgi:hypothetical protein
MELISCAIKYFAYHDLQGIWGKREMQAPAKCTERCTLKVMVD